MSRYLVVGNHEVDGVKPGGVVTIDDVTQARSLVRAGHVKAEAAKKKAPAKKKAAAAKPSA